MRRCLQNDESRYQIYAAMLFPLRLLQRPATHARAHTHMSICVGTELNSSAHLCLTPLLLDLSSVVRFNIFQLDGVLPSQV